MRWRKFIETNSKALADTVIFCLNGSCIKSVISGHGVGIVKCYIFSLKKHKAIRAIDKMLAHLDKLDAEDKLKSQSK